MVPTNKVDNIGIRKVSQRDEAEKVFDILEKPKDPYIHDANWSKRYNMNVDKIKSGDILEVAEVVRELSHRHIERGLSIGEKKMLNTAKNILLSEMVLSEDMSHDVLDNKIEEAIKLSYNAGIGTDTNVNSETSQSFGTISLN